MPMTPRCQRLAGHHEDGAGADVRIGLHDSFGGGEDLGFLLLPSDVFAVELNGQRVRLVGHGVVSGQQQTRRQIGRTHSSSGVEREAPA